MSTSSTQLAPSGLALSNFDLEAEERAVLIEDILTLEAIQAKAAPEHMGAWCYRYLPGMFSQLPGRLHRELWADAHAMLWHEPMEAADGENRDRVAAAYAAPRAHGKSTTLVIGLALWVIHEWQRMPHFRGRPPFIIITGDTAGNSVERVKDIRDQLEMNQLLHQDYGDLTPASRPPQGKRKRSTQTWTDHDFTTTTGVRVMAAHSHGSVRGHVKAGIRPNLILVDDLENDDLVITKLQRDKLEKWILKALIGTGGKAGKCLTIVIGTILHADSVLSRLLDERNFTSWIKRRYAALYNEGGLPDVDGTVPLWPEEWTLEALREQMRLVGPVAFAQEYLNLPYDDETSPFRHEWLTAAMNRGCGRGFAYGPMPRIPFGTVVSSWNPEEIARMAPPGALYQVVMTAWDLAFVDDEHKARERDSDYTVGITLGLRYDDKIDVIRLYRKRGMTPLDICERVTTEHDLIRPDFVVVENNAGGRLIEWGLKRDAKLPIVGFTTDSKKHNAYEGIPGLALLFQLGHISFCWASEEEKRKLDTLVGELHGIGAEAHDDTVMALWIALTKIRRWMEKRDDRRRKTIGDPPSSRVSPFPHRFHREEKR